jgi:hypothetical protein
MVVENAVNCRCSNSYGYTPRVTSTGCTEAAEGNAAEAGGGENAVNLWINKAYTAAVCQLSNCSKLKCSVLRKYFLLSHQGKYRVSTTALRPSHKHGKILWTHNGTMRHDDNSIPINDQLRHHEMDMQGDQPVSTPPLTFEHLTIHRAANMHLVHGNGKQGRSEGQGSDGHEMGITRIKFLWQHFPLPLLRVTMASTDLPSPITFLSPAVIVSQQTLSYFLEALWFISSVSLCI